MDHPKHFVNMAHKKIGQNLMQNDSLMKILESYAIVRLEDTEFNEKLSWCMEHCQSKFRDICESDCRAWYFQNAQDASMFAMRWA
jgi:MoaA/NifB/PqqE/SkfB family radical SAM enzyme